MADALFDAMNGGSPRAGGAGLLRLDALGFHGTVADVSFSGGVRNTSMAAKAKAFGDIGPQLAAELRTRLKDWSPQLVRPEARIRATVIGASQIHDAGLRLDDFRIAGWKETLPLRNVPVIAPTLVLDGETIEFRENRSGYQSGAQAPRSRDGQSPVAIFHSVARFGRRFRRLDDFCKGVAAGLDAVLAKGHPIVLARRRRRRRPDRQSTIARK